MINANQLVVGIHYGYNKNKTLKYGVFVGAIIDILYNKCKKNEINFNSKTVNSNIKIESKNVISGKKVDACGTLKSNVDEINEIVIYIIFKIFLILKLMVQFYQRILYNILFSQVIILNKLLK